MRPIEHTSPRQAGLSLVEVLMAVFILSLATAVIVLNMPAPRSEADTYLRAMERQLQKTADLAILGGVPLGVRLSEQSYAILSFRDGGWDVIEGGVYPFPPGLNLTLKGEGVDAPDFAVAEEDIIPQIVFDSTGAVTPVTLAFEAFSYSGEVHLPVSGEISIEWFNGPS